MIIQLESDLTDHSHRYIYRHVPQPNCRAASSKIVALKGSFLCLHHIVPPSMLRADIVAPSSRCVADI